MQPATLCSSAEVLTQMVPEHGADVKRVRSVSCQRASHLQSRESSSYFRNRFVRWHNQSASTTSFTLLPQPKTLHSVLNLLRARECICVFVCMCVCVFAFSPAFGTAAALHSRYGVCRVGEGPQGGTSERKEVPVLMKTSHTHLCLSFSVSASLHVRSESDKADRWSCVSAFGSRCSFDRGVKGNRRSPRSVTDGRHLINDHIHLALQRRENCCTSNLTATGYGSHLHPYYSMHSTPPLFFYLPRLSFIPLCHWNKCWCEVSQCRDVINDRPQHLRAWNANNSQGAAR